MICTSSLFSALLLAASTIATPLTSGGCSTEKALLTLPDGQDKLAKQTGPPSFALLGAGVQNYTCGADGKYAAAGAVADLYDISCLGGTSKFSTVQDEAYGLLKDGKASCISSKLHLDPSGKHFFTPTASGTAPVWDMRAVGPKGVQGKTGAYVLAAKVANLPAPSGTGDVDWLQLKNVEGLLAKDIYRTETRGGQPPASCAVGSGPISVIYTSKYFLFGSTV